MKVSIKDLLELVQATSNQTQQPTTQATLNCMIGKKVIIRTYSAGVWFGELEQSR